MFDKTKNRSGSHVQIASVHRQQVAVDIVGGIGGQEHHRPHQICGLPPAPHGDLRGDGFHRRLILPELNEAVLFKNLYWNPELFRPFPSGGGQRSSGFLRLEDKEEKGCSGKDDDFFKK